MILFITKQNKKYTILFNLFCKKIIIKKHTHTHKIAKQIFHQQTKRNQKIITQKKIIHQHTLEILR